MKRLFYLLPILASVMACGSSLPPLATLTPASTATACTTTVLVASPSPLPVVSYQEGACLVVTASQSLHLRKDPTEHSQALDWLYFGDEVNGLVKEGDWWLVDTGQKQGYVRAEFVEVCR